MTLSPAQQSALGHLRSAYVGPDGGPDEILMNRPTLQYSVGILFPREEAAPADDGSDTDEGDEVAGEVAATGEVEEDGATVPIAEDWRPSSVAISFITDHPAVSVRFAGATYSAIDDGGPPRWQRRPFTFDDLALEHDSGPQQLAAGDVPIEVGARWRVSGEAYLVTVHARVLACGLGQRSNRRPERGLPSRTRGTSGRGRCDRGVRHDSGTRAGRRIRRTQASLQKQEDLRGRPRHVSRLGRIRGIVHPGVVGARPGPCRSCDRNCRFQGRRASGQGAQPPRVVRDRQFSGRSDQDRSTHS